MTCAVALKRDQHARRKAEHKERTNVGTSKGTIYARGNAEFTADAKSAALPLYTTSRMALGNETARTPERKCVQTGPVKHRQKRDGGYNSVPSNYKNKKSYSSTITCTIG